jgi:hypothetical protein
MEAVTAVVSGEGGSNDKARQNVASYRLSGTRPYSEVEDTQSAPMLT